MCNKGEVSTGFSKLSLFLSYKTSNGGKMALEIKKSINIQDNKLTNGLIPVFHIMEMVESSNEEEVVFDCSSVKFSSPVFAISMLLYLRSCSKRYRMTNLSAYLKTIMFDDVLTPDAMSKEDFKRILGGYEKKTFIPIVSFPASEQLAKNKDAILSAVEEILCRQVNIPGNIISGLKYILGEMVDNITEHSDSERGFIFAQAYPGKRFLDICIADEGITLRGSYLKAGIEIEDDLEAMKAANKCISSKNLPDAENRGYGIKTTKRMLSVGLGGQYMIMSGNAIGLKSQTIDRIIQLPRGIRWNGTVIALRIPYQENNSFKYWDYLE